MTNDISSISSLFALLSNGSASGTASTTNADQEFLNLLDGLGGGSGSGSGSSSDIFGSTSPSLGLSSAALSVLNGEGIDTSGMSTINDMAIQDTLDGNGPLPAYLKQVDAGMGLSATQAQSLQNIAIENMNTDGSQASVDKIAEELQQAGIG